MNFSEESYEVWNIDDYEQYFNQLALPEATSITDQYNQELIESTTPYSESEG